MKNTTLTLIAGFTLGIIFFLFFGNNLPYPLSPFNQPTITVTGIGKAETENTEAQLTITIRRQADSSQDASNQVTETSNSLFEVISKYNIPSADIQTENINSYETYVPSNEPEIMIYPPKPRSSKKVWEATQTISLKIKDVAIIDRLTTDLQNLENIELMGPNFQVDQDSLNKQLLENAIKDAKEKGEIIAKSNNQKLGKISSISDYSSGVPYYEQAPLMTKDMSGSVSNTRVEPGSTKLTREIQVTFFLR